MYCKHEKIVSQAYSPLTRTRRLNDSQLNGIAVRYNKRPAQILIRWNIQLGAVPIPKANQKQHIEENMRVFDFEIKDEDRSRLAI
jgi:2,5-diketo-D-gluconate reductase A